MHTSDTLGVLPRMDPRALTAVAVPPGMAGVSCSGESLSHAAGLRPVKEVFWGEQKIVLVVLVLTGLL